jgi:hypothetical protein
VALERRSLLLRFEQTDWGRDPRPTLSRRWRLGLLAAVSFIFLWPLIGIGVGALDTRVHDLDDISHLKLVPLGHLRAASGKGSLRQRIERRRSRRS